jgi:hypothetical protein
VRVFFEVLTYRLGHEEHPGATLGTEHNVRIHDQKIAEPGVSETDLAHEEVEFWRAAG